MALRVKRSTVQQVDGHDCLVLYGAADDGAEVGVAVPLEALPTVMADATRRGLALRNKLHEETGGWKSQHMLTAQKYGVTAVRTKEGQRVGLAFDPGLATEVLFSISAEDAKTLVLELSKAIEELDTQAAGTH